ncbi:MAG: thermonuclease family protein, partial [archaeon]
GINTPDKEMLYYNEATQFSRQAENKTVMIESHGGDQYGRILAYVYLDDKMINEEIVRAGFAHLYYYEMDSHYNELKKSEEYARLNGFGMWKPSSSKSCFSLIELKHTEPERVILQNSCNRSFNLVMKDDASAHIVKRTINSNSIIQQNSSHVFNDAGDSLYVWDDSGLVVFERY